MTFWPLELSENTKLRDLMFVSFLANKTTTLLESLNSFRNIMNVRHSLSLVKRTIKNRFPVKEKDSERTVA